MNQYLMKNVRFNPAIKDQELSERTQLSALILEITNEGIADLTVFDPTGGSYLEKDIPMCKAEDDGSFSTWEPVGTQE